MPGLVETGLRLLRSLTGEPPGAPALLPGHPAALRGSVAVAVTEACVAEVAGLGGSAPADLLAAAWEAERSREGLNLLGGALASVAAPSSRGTLASTLGLALAGTRATAFLSGPNLAGQHDLLAAAAGRHVPMVVHGVARALDGHAGARGSGHEAWHAVADAGLIQLFARNVQEAVDLALIGRRVAEAVLRPVLVFMDEETTAAATQDVRMPTADLVRRYLGAPGDRIDCPTPAQRLLFGPQRRRVPRWHDLERPVLHGAIQGREVWALGAVAQRRFCAQDLTPAIEDAFAAFAALTGRRHGLLHAHRTEDAEVAIVAQGSGAETAEAVADHLRGHSGVKVGVLSLIGLRPFPGPAICAALRGRRAVVVLERADALLSEDPPLLREVRAALARGAQDGRPAGGPPERIPRLGAVIGGLGGHPLRAQDLAAAVEAARRGGRPLTCLGVDFSRDTRYPKRRVLLDQLARDWPPDEAPGIRAEPGLDVRPAGAVTLTIHRLGGLPSGALASHVGRLLFAALGGSVRGRAGEGWERWQSACVDRIVHAPAPADPGATGPVDLAVILALPAHAAVDPLADLRSGGAALVAAPGRDGQPLLPPDLWRGLAARDIRVVPVACPAGATDPAFRERVLALALRLLAERGLALPARKKLLAARATLLDDLDAEAVTARLAAFEAALDEPLPSAGAPPAPTGVALPATAPMAVRHFHRADGTCDSLPRFWDQVGILFRDGRTDELVPDPYLATGVIPPLTASFNDLAPLRRTLPAWDPGTCTGCGRCWTGCPDSAIGPLAAGLPALIEAGMALAASRGAAVDALRPLLSRILARASKRLLEGEAHPGPLGPILAEAGGAVLGRAGLSPERAQQAEAALAAVVGVLGDLPIAITAPFFAEPEARQGGTGEVLGLAINPDACKGCAVCEAACPGGALRLLPQDAERVARARRDWRRWEQLPDVRGETVARVRDHAEVGPLAAMMLSRTCLLGLSGGDSAEAGSGEKIAVRLVLAAAEYVLQPQVQRHLDQVDGLRARLDEALGARLAQALPTGDPAALAAGLRGVGQPEIDLCALLARVAGQGERARVDVAQVGRLADLAGRLQDLRWRLAQGPDGLGRARFALALEPGPVAAWAGAFPDNPFHVPVAVAGAGEGLHLARGLLEGQLRAVLDDLRLVREARVALDRPGEYAREREDLARLGWRGLGADERRLIPPVVVLGHEAALTGRNLAALATVLDLDLPIKVVVLADSDLGIVAGGAAEPDERGSGWAGSLGEIGLLALGRRGACVAQGSLAEPRQLFRGLTSAMAHPGPALVRIHCPSPARHGFAAHRTLDQARRALACRAFPVFRYDPSEDGAFGTCLHLDGNPDPLAGWLDGCTAADWAATEARFAAELPPLGPQAPDPTPLAAWLDLPPHTRHGRTPFVAGPDGRRLAPSPRLAAAAAERLRTWRALQELAGLVTPFTARVREEAERELSARHSAAVAELEARHAAALEAQRAAIEAELAQRVQQGLLALAGYGRAGD